MKILLSVLFVLISLKANTQSIDQFLESNNDLIEAKGNWKALLVYSENGKLKRGYCFLLETNNNGLIFSKSKRLNFIWRSPKRSMIAIEWKDLRSLSFKDLSKKKGLVATTTIAGGIIGGVIGIRDVGFPQLQPNFAGVLFGMASGLIIGNVISNAAEDFFFDDSDDLNELQQSLIKYEMARRYRE